MKERFEEAYEKKTLEKFETTNRSGRVVLGRRSKRELEENEYEIENLMRSEIGL